MSNTYSNVDGSRDVADALDWQDRIDAWPAIQAYKQRTYELLGDAHPALDVGCGTGLDAVALSAFGVDRSQAMCERATGPDGERRDRRRDAAAVPRCVVRGCARRPRVPASR